MTDYSPKKTLIQIFDIPLEVVKRLHSDRVTRHAAALSFNSLLAIAPMMAIAFSMLSLFTSLEDIGSSFESVLYGFLVPAVGEDVKTYLDQFAGQAGKLSVVGLGFFLLTALLLLFNIEESFNDIWGVEKGRSMTSRLTVYWALVSLGPLLMGASLTLSTYLLSLAMLAGDGIGAQVQSAGVTLLPFLFEAAAFLLLYLVMPNARVKLVHAVVGAVVASLLFELSKKGFGLYLVNFGNYKVVYGALSALPIFLIWIYLSWLIALIGAQVVAILRDKDMLDIESPLDTQ